MKVEKLEGLVMGDLWRRDLVAMARERRVKVGLFVWWRLGKLVFVRDYYSRWELVRMWCEVRGYLARRM